MTGKTLRNAQGEKTSQERILVVRGQGKQRTLISAAAIAGAILLVGATAAPLCAQSFPHKPIRFIIGMAAGGTQDILGRIIGQNLTERLGQTVLVDNRGGSAGNIAYEVAANARPDGYTIVQCSSSIAISPSLYRKLNYDPIKGFAPISLVAELPFLLVVRSSPTVNNLKDFLEYARANPGKLNYGSSGLGTAPQLGSELINSLAKINIAHIPYKGASQMLSALVGGEVDMLVVGPGVSMPFIESGKVRALAALGKERLASLPNVPVAKEVGIDNLVVTSWQGILAPAGTPPDIVSRLSAEWIKVAATPGARNQLQRAGFEPLSSTPQEFSEHIKAEIIRWGKVIKDANISLD